MCCSRHGQGFAAFHFFKPVGLKAFRFTAGARPSGMPSDSCIYPPGASADVPTDSTQEDGGENVSRTGSIQCARPMWLWRGKYARASTLSLLLCFVQGGNNTIEDGRRERSDQVIECERDTQSAGGQRVR